MRLDLEALACVRAEEQLRSDVWKIPEKETTPEPLLALKTDGAEGRCGAFGCKRKIRARGFCDMHYRRAIRFGLIERVR